MPEWYFGYCEALSESRGNLATKNKTQEATPLDLACKDNHVDAVWFLVRRNAASMGMIEGQYEMA